MGTSTTGATALADQVSRVALARKAAADAAADLKQLQDAFDEAHAELIRTVSDSKVLVFEEERRLRDMAVAEHKATGDLHPAPGVGIRTTTVLQYDERAAFTWAMEHKMCLQLNKKGFEDVARSNSLDFVTVDRVPQATLAKELPLPEASPSAAPEAE